MIQLKKLILENFTVIDYVEIIFEGKEVIVVTGENASGKSSILDAVAICFTDRKVGDSYKDYVQKGKETGRVYLEAIFLNKPIVFDYKLRNKKHGNPVDRKIEYEGETYSGSEATKFLSSFNISYLDHIMFSMQGDRDIINLRPAERAKLLKELTEAMTGGSEHIAEALETLDKAIQQHQEDLITQEATLNVLSNQTEIFHETFREMSQEKEESYQKKLSETEEKAKELALQVRENESILTTINKKKEELSSAEAHLRTLISGQDNATKELASLKINEEDIRKRLDALESDHQIEETIEEVALQLNTYKDHIDAHRVSSMDAKQKQVEILTRISQLETHIKAHQTGVCVSCGQKTNPSSVPVLQKELEEAKEEAHELKTSVANLQQLEADAMLQYNNYLGEHTTWKNKKTQNKEIRSRYQQMESQYKERRSFLEQELTSKKGIIDSQSQKIELIREEASALEAQASQAGQIVLQHKAIQEEETTLRELLRKNKEIKDKNKMVEDMNLQATQREKDRKRKLAEISKKMDKLKLNIQTDKEAKRIIGVVLPNYMVIKTVTALEKHINIFVQEVMPGLSTKLFQTKAGIEFQYCPRPPKSDDDWLSAKMASGFEKELLAVAWRVALAKSYKLPSLFFDEIDSAANPLKSETMFRKLAQETDFNQLFIVSHSKVALNCMRAERDKVAHYEAAAGVFDLQEEEY
jgi:chromosome segregation ATPase